MTIKLVAAQLKGLTGEYFDLELGLLDSKTEVQDVVNEWCEVVNQLSTDARLVTDIKLQNKLIQYLTMLNLESVEPYFNKISIDEQEYCSNYALLKAVVESLSISKTLEWEFVFPKRKSLLEMEEAFTVLTFYDYSTSKILEEGENVVMRLKLD